MAASTFVAASEGVAVALGTKTRPRVGNDDDGRENDDEAAAAAESDLYPRKKYFRSRAHCNPLSNNDGFEYPARPQDLEWAALYPAYGAAAGAQVRYLDVGCGFGGLCVALATLAPRGALVLGLEIRPKVCEFVRQRVEALRASDASGGDIYAGVSCYRLNAMVHLPNLIGKAQLDKIFFCFPDPHFKAKNHRRRVVSAALLAEYAYALRPGGLLYAVTDVEALHLWHVAKCDAHACFEKVVDLTEADPFVRACLHETEEGKKVARNGGSKYWAVYRRKRPDDIDAEPDLFAAGGAVAEEEDSGGGGDTRTA